jgi:hypothetical protein
MIDFIDHYISTHNYINDNISILKYDPEFLFTEEAISFLEMKQTETRRSLAIKYHLNKFRIGTNPNTVSLQIKTLPGKVNNHAYFLALAMLKEKATEVSDGVETSVSFKLTKTGNTLNISLFNTFKPSLSSECLPDEITKAKQNFDSLKSEPSDTIIIDLSTEQPWQEYWNQFFDIVGIFIGLTRGQWICKFYKNKIEFNENRFEDASKKSRYFHVKSKSKYSQKIINMVHVIDKAYNIRIDTRGTFH